MNFRDTAAWHLHSWQDIWSIGQCHTGRVPIPLPVPVLLPVPGQRQSPQARPLGNRARALNPLDPREEASVYQEQLGWKHRESQVPQQAYNSFRKQVAAGISKQAE